MPNWLGYEWWQGIGGIAQLVAAIFAVISIRQAHTMILMAQEERHEAIAPNWESDPDNPPKLERADPQGDGTASVHLAFENMGYGPARQPAWEFTNYDGRTASGPSNPRRRELITRAGDRFFIDFRWPEESPRCLKFSGTLVIRCTSRGGRHLAHAFSVEGWYDALTSDRHLEAHRIGEMVVERPGPWARRWQRIVARLRSLEEPPPRA